MLKIYAKSFVTCSYTVRLNDIMTPQQQFDFKGWNTSDTVKQYGSSIALLFLLSLGLAVTTNNMTPFPLVYAVRATIALNHVQ